MFLSIALYLRRPKDAIEPKWGEGFISYSEKAYYENHIIAIINKWKEEGNQSENPLGTLLVIDLDKKALWVEDNGRINEDYYIEFPTATNCMFNNHNKIISLEKGRIILKNVDEEIAKKIPEKFSLMVSGIERFINITVIDTRQKGLKIPVSVITSKNLDDLNIPFVVTKDEYEQYIKSLANTFSSQNDKESTSSESLSELDKNKAAWKRIEKNLYKKIEKNVNKAGYELVFISAEPFLDFTGVHSSVMGYNSNFVIEILNRNPEVYADLGIIHLENDIWYAASRLPPKRTRSKREMKLEFVISPDGDISKTQEKQYIKQGREIFKKHFIPLNS